MKQSKFPAIAPKIQVLFGFPSSSITIVVALSLYHFIILLLHLSSLRVCIITALITSDLSRGEFEITASLMTTIITSPI